MKCRLLWLFVIKYSTPRLLQKYGIFCVPGNWTNVRVFTVDPTKQLKLFTFHSAMAEVDVFTCFAEFGEECTLNNFSVPLLENAWDSRKGICFDVIEIRSLSTKLSASSGDFLCERIFWLKSFWNPLPVSHSSHKYKFYLYNCPVFCVVVLPPNHFPIQFCFFHVFCRSALQLGWQNALSWTANGACFPKTSQMTSQASAGKSSSVMWGLWPDYC